MTQNDKELLRSVEPVAEPSDPPTAPDEYDRERDDQLTTEQDRLDYVAEQIEKTLTPDAQDYKDAETVDE